MAHFDSSSHNAAVVVESFLHPETAVDELAGKRFSSNLIRSTSHEYNRSRREKRVRNFSKPHLNDLQVPTTPSYNRSIFVDIIGLAYSGSQM